MHGRDFVMLHIVLDLILEAKCSPAEYGAVLSYGDDCQHKCRCLGNEQCDNETGQCSSGCAPGWAGPGCQYG